MSFSIRVLLVLAFAALMHSVTYAQDDLATRDQKSRKSVRTDARGKPITVIDFDDANIEGRVKSPEGFIVQSRGQSSFRNIIELRRNFRPQIQASQNDGHTSISH